MTNLKEEIYLIYKKVRTIKNPDIKQKVVFNRYGWIHLSFDSRGHRRSSRDRRLRLNLFRYAHEVVRNSKCIIKETEGRIKSKRGKERSVKYYEIASICNGGKNHITVTIRKIENGNSHFWSIRRTSTKTKKALKKEGLL
ncbi:hypothetical protein A2130_03025 [Candidatus Woesebacteria bacterium GWC2_33_12]|uniref:Large polyvalent protein-associated domain-containing protein n=1 Tax=Candidatus Woesebacteria bacterium GW2011_GWB1_33_22 TaxID=1618566 RepID=A0A0G0C247_9BACT|nr:MAG: hypothetical protein UR29_C0009G0038 [Candidatus Woesebacteria bacterium GW2011_GWC2_33_12]KKP42462.1 MAG: hypothetical protein UR33_C0002G0038 [Candidatus Woesebacteria bacterium GW2011_GWA2_33_20]KKP45205.1 MAG: hypothetical protein UR35_C0002G0038 [Candidatus Woesebacteria bacterium GW2011_GWB1_33_22]KKP46204.1 MAG: hypothetical protein UR37_C0011G0038 [Microgenomates group bacterium GW2011_GWC1_33_28]KKP50874.1 MAG: hypothetical protein UR41_C0002G0038 [Candidatus Woesebacteria bact